MSIELSLSTTAPVNVTKQPATDSVEKFESAMRAAEDKPAGLNALTNPLASLNRHSESLATQAAGLEARDMKPSELLLLTMRSHEFLFHCELVSNVANRSSDGVQQLFRQQS